MRGMEMKKRTIAWLIVLAVCLGTVPALAANVFMFTEKAINIFEGDTYPTELKREGTGKNTCYYRT